MFPDTTSLSSDSSYTWESLLNKTDVLITDTSRILEQALDGTSKEHNHVDDLGVSCNDFDWDQRSAMSSFSLYLAIDESSRVSLLDCCSLDGHSLDCGATKVTAETDVLSSLSSAELAITNIDITVHRREYESEESVITEVYSMHQEGTDESEYEVQSLVTEAKEPTDFCILHREWKSEGSVITEVHERDEEDTDESEYEVQSFGTELKEATNFDVIHREWESEESVITKAHGRDEEDSDESEYEVKSLATEAKEALDFVFRSECTPEESVITKPFGRDEEDTDGSEYEIKSLATEAKEVRGIGVFHSEL